MSQTWPVTLAEAAAPDLGGRGAPKACAISVQGVDGGWAQLGADTMRGVWPENVEIVSDAWGPKTLTFDLHRDPDVPWPDIAAWAPVEAVVGGVLVWSGRITDAPTRSADHVISVHCEGWQAHLDDDQFERKLVHTKLADWQDVRAHLTTDLGEFIQAGSVNSGRGIVLSWPKDAVVPNNKSVAVGLDLGPGNAAKRVIVTWEGTISDTGQSIDCRGSDSGFVTSGSEQAASFSASLSTGSTSGTARGTFSTARRYVWLLLYQGKGSTITPTADDTLRITSVEVFADTAYESGDASVLRGDTVITDAVTRATMQLASDLSGIEQTTDFVIPEFAPDAPRTPRQTIEATNVFFDHLAKVDERRRMIFRDRPTVPDVRIGAWGASDFQDASGASVDDVYSRVIAAGRDPSGSPVRVERTQAQQPGVTPDIAVSPTPDNPGFETDTASWTAGGSTISRYTGIHDTGSACGRWDNTGAGDVLGVGDTLTETFTGTFFAGIPYRLTFKWRPNSAMTRAAPPFDWEFGHLASGDKGDNLAGYRILLDYPASFQLITCLWVPETTHTSGVTLKLTSNVAGRFFYLDTLVLYQTRATVVERRGGRKTHTLDSGFTLTDLSAERLGDKFMQAHKVTPFKGSGQAVGHRSIRDYTTGQYLGPERLLLYTGGLMHFDDRIDPDTGALGRDGRLVQVTYRPETDTATFDIDSSRGDFDTLLAKAGVVVGQLN